VRFIVAVALCFGPHASAATDATASRDAVATLKAYLDNDSISAAAEIESQPFASVPLSKADAEAARKLLWEDHAKRIRTDRSAEIKERVIRDGDLQMKFAYDVFGEKPANGRSLFISMHGGGNAQARVNDQQWENQKHLYKPAEGIYLAPRAPTNTWNLW